MASTTRFELTSTSPEASFAGNYQNGQRGYSTPTLDRSTSFRDSAEIKNFASGKANSRGSVSTSGDVTTLSQWLMLEPIVIGDQKHARSGDLRRVLGVSIGSTSEDNPFGAVHLKNSSPGAVDELKRLRASVADTCVKARNVPGSGALPQCLAKKLDDHLNKLNKYVEVSSKKQQQRNEMLANERSSGSILKIGSLIHRNTTEFGSQKFDERPKNGGLNKRLRTSVADNRAECKVGGASRQPMSMARERDMLKDSNADSDTVEGKIKRLPAGGEGWDKKMKRKRSVGAAFSRSIDNDGELKRTMHHKLPGESSLQSGDSTPSIRSGASGSSSKLDPASSPASSSARTTLKGEQEKSMLSRDLSPGPMKERTLGKLNVSDPLFRMGNREGNSAMCPSPILKGKASRAPRNGSMVSASSASNVSRVSGTLESWEQLQAVNKTSTIGGANNRKRTIPGGSSSPPITQWVGQRPQKISRTRRTNLIPVSNHDDVQMQSEGCSPSDFSPRLSSFTNAAHSIKGSASENINFKGRSENASSPARLSESEESGGGEIRIKEKGLGSGDGEEKDANATQNVGPTAIPVKKNKIMVKEESGDGVRRQGRSGRMSPFSRTSPSPTREKMDNEGTPKPQRNARSSEKNGSKSGRPLKKLSDRKGFSRLGHIANGGSPDCSGESEDDREELITAANLAFHASCMCSEPNDHVYWRYFRYADCVMFNFVCYAVNACSGAFWKTVEPLFASVDPDEESFLSGQDDYSHENMAAPDSVYFGGYRSINNEIRSDSSLDRMGFVDRLRTSPLYGCSERERRYDVVPPLYQRVLSALIVEDEIEESEDTGFGRMRSSIHDSRFLIGADCKPLDKISLSEPMFGTQIPKTNNAHIVFSCNGNANYDRSHNAQDHYGNGEVLQRDDGYVHSEVEVLVRLSRCDYVLQSLQANNCGVSSFECQYEQMCVEEKLVLELQSVGLYLEAVPALNDNEDEVMNEEIVQLEKKLHEQMRKKKSCLDTLYEAVQEGKKIGRSHGKNVVFNYLNDKFYCFLRDPEQIAMDKLVELAYKKLLATKRSFASKHGIAKVSKQVALAFAKRTLARCRKFEMDSRASCFSDPALRDIIFAAPPRFDDTEMLACAGQIPANDGSLVDAFDQAFAKKGPISNRAKRKELLLDDVGGAVFRASSAMGISDGAKGKRSERDPPKTGRLSMGCYNKGESKAKSNKPKKTAQLPTGDKFSLSESGNSSGSKRKDVRFISSGGLPPPASSSVVKESSEFGNLLPNDIDGIDDLGVDSEIGEPQDLNSWFNFDVDGIQDNDLVGLEIPMDDLAELNMF
ncbi:chloroplast Ycf2 [Striga asiatica]|uniref:Chloroplast Ycf2 n=1 Tax=Striga asiatica TaxID=4170 RepID=A0A5A7P800_STRAF|nr:chloroplast Ycf2 [Striga asiatica]